MSERNVEKGKAFHTCNKSTESEMSDRDRAPVEKETVIVERGSGGGLIAGIALLIAVVAVLAYFGMLPI
jgi:hypothetical protein